MSVNNPNPQVAIIETLPRKPEFVRRYKSVTARRVKKGELVETVDGEVWAKPGDWVLTEFTGGRMVYPNWKFREEYEPVNEEAKELWNEGA